ncbi:MAG: undecaprenyl-diphosphatase [Rhodospirillales bacterium]|nr:undecaprenyl-diphosphatase [Rhodospirillales bacterium]MDE2198310.1 undecaprenyl-diphosphatase [Rhodospirillales bacterium]MDE2576306.1 undecaprenyl-diphosphatase [Rhodospirillales bacterium]
MPTWNLFVYHLLNAASHPAPAAVTAMALLANSPVIVVSASLVLLWVRGAPAHRAGVLATALAVLAALGVNQLLGLLWFEPRPFMVPVGHTLITHAADNSFPSDHATFIWSFAGGLIASRAAPGWGRLAILYGLAVAWARIWLGVHFPIDMLGAALVALPAAWFAHAITAPVRSLLLPPCERLYEAALRALCLPPALFPRRPI